MVTIAAIGVVVGLASTVVGWRLTGHLFDGVDDSLNVATQSLDSVDRSITVIETIVDDVREGVTTLDRSLDDVVNATETTVDAVDELSTQAPRLADAVASLRDGVAGVGDAGTTIDETLEAIDDLPGVPNYSPSQSVGDSVASLVDDLDAIAATLRSFDQGVRDVDESVAPLLDDMRQARADLAQLDTSLASSSTLLEEYRQSAISASDIAVRTRKNLRDDVRATRLLIVLGGILFTVGQIVPYWLGRTVLLEVEAARLRAEDEVDAESATASPNRGP
jgi:methyl-accepting chemotaxis protein